jgi:hypothetical protein
MGPHLPIYSTLPIISLDNQRIILHNRQAELSFLDSMCDWHHPETYIYLPRRPISFALHPNLSVQHLINYHLLNIKFSP